MFRRSHARSTDAHAEHAELASTRAGPPADEAPDSINQKRPRGKISISAGDLRPQKIISLKMAFTLPRHPALNNRRTQPPVQVTGAAAARQTAGIDVNRPLINPIAASRGFTPKLLKYLLLRPCAYRCFTSYVA
jgi:hypothetical protein